MKVTFNTFSISPSMGSKKETTRRAKKENELSSYLDTLKQSKTATVSPLPLMKGINPDNRNVFDTFTKIDDVTREINFVRSKESWDNCLLEEMEEFTIARLEYEQSPTKQNYDHMEEEMGDIFYTAASIAKNTGINPEEAFRSTNRKFFNRINVMDRMLKLRSNGENKDLKACTDSERRALWNAAKRKIYDVQSMQYLADA